MRERYGKPVDPREFKHEDLSNLTDRVEQKRRRARDFYPQATIDVNACYVCGSEDSKIVREMFGYEYAKCQNCTHVYQTCRLPDDILVEYYETNDDFVSMYTDEEQVEYRLENITKPKIDYVLEHVDVDEGRWLDVGCGLGASVQYLESIGWDAVGLEISEECVTGAREAFGIELTQQPLDEYAEQNSDETFDVITFIGYLELVPHAMRDLELANEMLDTDGTIGVGAMNAESISSQVHRAIPDAALRHSIPPIGLQQFTLDSIRTAFERTGFSAEAAWYFGLDFYELLTQLCLEIDGFHDSDLYDYLMNNQNDFQQVIDDDVRSDYMLIIGDRQ